MGCSPKSISVYKMLCVDDNDTVIFLLIVDFFGSSSAVYSFCLSDT